MKFKKSGQVALALAVSLGLSLGLTSCVNDYTVAYLYVTGAQYSQIGAFKISNNTGNLTAIPGQPFGSGGKDPVRALVSTTGRYIYVLNAGDSSTDAAGNTTYASAGISVLSVGGNGVLAPQQTYQSQGYGATRFALSQSGAYLYVLDKYAPTAGKDASGNPLVGSTTPMPGMSCQDSSGIYHPVGDITVYQVDSSTGRLSLITNTQLQDAQGKPLSYFPVGCEPIDFETTGAYLLTADTSDPATGNPFTIFPYAANSTSGQLTTTQNTEFPTGAQGISAIGANASKTTIYILDPVSNNIWYYTVGSNGLLTSYNTSPTPNSQTVAGNPVAMTTDSKSQFLYVANAGPSTNPGQAGSDISAYNISSNGALQPIPEGPFGTGSGPQCIIEDPSNQFIFTADYNSGTVTGKVLDPRSGDLNKMRNKNTFATVGNPTWCVADSHTD
ncbi:MAG: beta-propeller fold lactonase family protein [Acidobacteriaceae bacterium]